MLDAVLERKIKNHQLTREINKREEMEGLTMLELGIYKCLQMKITHFKDLEEELIHLQVMEIALETIITMAEIISVTRIIIQGILVRMVTFINHLMFLAI